jgi:hypothetical protein
MHDEDAAFKETIEHFGEASRRVRAARHLMPHRALVDAPNYLRLGARLSKTLDATEVAHSEARRRGDSL